MLHACTYCDVKEVLPVHVIGCSYLLVVDTVGKKSVNTSRASSLTCATMPHFCGMESQCYMFIPDCGHCVQSITLQPDCLALDLIRSDVESPAVVPVGITNPLIEPIIPAICMHGDRQSHISYSASHERDIALNLQYGSLMMPLRLENR